MNPARDAILYHLRIAAQMKGYKQMENIKRQIPGLTSEQELIIAHELEVAAVSGVAQVLFLTPQQFNAVRVKHG